MRGIKNEGVEESRASEVWNFKEDRQGKSSNYNEPQFPHPKHEDYNSTEYLRKTEWGGDKKYYRNYKALYMYQLQFLRRLPFSLWPVESDSSLQVCGRNC